MRFFGVEALHEQVAPADAVIGVLGILLDQIAELVVGFLIAFDPPQTFGAQIGIGARGQLGIASLRLGQFAVMAQHAAVVQCLNGRRLGGQRQCR